MFVLVCVHRCTQVCVYVLFNMGVYMLWAWTTTHFGKSEDNVCVGPPLPL